MKIRPIPTLVQQAPAIIAGPLTAEVMTVTPELAAKWLEKNHPSNRPVAWKRVEAFANDIRSHRWMLTHQGVCFDADGMLIDGQHRLQAIVHAGMAVQMLVCRTQSTGFDAPIDRGAVRTIAMLLGQGANNKSVACLSVLRQLEQGCQLHTPLTIGEARDTQERHEQALQGIYGSAKLVGGVQAALAWTWPIAPAEVTEFIAELVKGEMIKRGDPAYSLRNWLDQNKRAQPWECAMAALNCCRYRIVGREILGVYTTSGGYRAITSQRRSLAIPNTPATSMVEPMALQPAKGDR